MFEHANSSYRDVTQYPEQFLKIDMGKIRIPVTYKKSWDDGFGARGWKVDVTIGDPQIIASTRETGQRINTSVFVHDILDHFLSGFGISGHRSEAMALIQLSRRTGASPEPDYRQIIEEDILHGRVNGESMKSFLPSSLMELLPNDEKMTDKEIILFLKDKLGNEGLTDVLVKHFFSLGKTGEEHAENNWKKLGLDYEKQKKLGNALQKLLVEIDCKVEEVSIEEDKGIITIDSNHVSFGNQEDSHAKHIGSYQVTIN
jgi:hypothetical protein